jgi:putative endonuclease
MTTMNNTALYTGVTNNVKRRVYEHKEKFIPGFTARYNIIKLVYYERFNNVNDALLNEKRIKGGSRKKKIALIESVNKEWKDLYYEL